MRESVKIALRVSEVRERLNEIAGLSGDDLTEEVRSEQEALTSEFAELEQRGRAAIVADEAERVERATNAEFRQLVEQGDVGEIFDACIERRETAGATRELQTELGLSGHQVPLALLTEERAVTPAPANVHNEQHPIIPAVFPDAVAAFLHIDTPTVGVGEQVFPVLTTSAAVRDPAESGSAAETTGAFSADVLTPRRLQASFFYTREDRARFRGMGEALRENLSMALADALDKEIVNGDDGLLNGSNLSSHNTSTESNFASYLKDFAYGRVDGKYASSVRDLRIVVGPPTYAHMGETYRNNSVDRNALERLMEVTGGVRVSAHVPAVSSNRQNGVIRRGSRRDAVAPIWEGVTLIPDEITKAATGEIVITAVMLFAMEILRGDGFYKRQAQLA